MALREARCLKQLATEGTHLMLPTLHQGCAHNRARDWGLPRPIAPSAPLTGCAVGQQGSSPLEIAAGTLHMHEHDLNIWILTNATGTCLHMTMSQVLTAAAGALQTIYVEDSRQHNSATYELEATSCMVYYLICVSSKAKHVGYPHGHVSDIPILTDAAGQCCCIYAHQLYPLRLAAVCASEVGTAAETLMCPLPPSPRLDTEQDKCGQKAGAAPMCTSTS